MTNITPLPFWQMCCVVSLQIAEAMNIYVLFPFIVAMVEDFGYSGAELGYYTGGLAAAFCGAQFVTAVVWGKLSDKYGRKPILIFGTFGAGLGMLIFGFSRTYTQAILGRVVSGLLSGNLGVVKSFLNEITDESNRGAGFAYLSLSMSIGAILAPLAGGLLSQPADKYAPFSNNKFLQTYPYILPCLFCSIFTLSAALCTWLLMKETRITRDYSKLDTGDIELNVQSSKFVIEDDESDDEYDDVHAIPCMKQDKVYVLWRRRVVIAISNYGMIAMSYILIDETLPLFLKLDSEKGGFSFDSSQIGILYSYAGIAMLLFTSLALPRIASMPKSKLFIIASIGAILSVSTWPIIAWLNYNIFSHWEKNGNLMKWGLLIMAGITRNCFGAMHYNAVMIQVNDQVCDKNLGIVNGMGQSIAALSRAIGPALGGVLWSFSIEEEMIFLNFVGAVCLLIICQILNCQLPPPKVVENQ